ncbi:MAG: aldehyde dehydrogenase family protein, partial [Crocinitomicaceae bacterium]|nr:aldehyde dehydrogenase family protein [Crocinitomicaceae bacterium]
MEVGNFIGNTLSFSNGLRFKSLNPKNNQFNSIELVEATPEEIQKTCIIAHKAFPKFNATDPLIRAQLLLQIAKLLQENSSELLHWYQIESGLSEDRGKIELQRTIQQLEDFASEISIKNWKFTHSKPETVVKGIKTSSLKKIKQGIGPVLVFGASNFPFAYSTIGGDSVAALAAGCPVIVKSHPFHAVLSYKVAELVLNAGKLTGMPDGFFSHLNAKNHEVGKLLVLHPAIKAIGFTGSIKGGLAIRKLSLERPDEIPVFAEMGSLNPVVILPSAITSKTDIQEISAKLAQSITQSSGQFCTKPGLIFLIENDSTP